jgi:hypothetical protein
MPTTTVCGHFDWYSQDIYISSAVQIFKGGIEVVYDMKLARGFEIYSG